MAIPTLPRRIDLLIGVSGSGKTLLARELLFDHDRVIILDHRDEYHVGAPFWDFAALAAYAETRPHFVAVWKGDRALADSIFHLAFALRRVCVLMSEAEIYPVEENSWTREAVLRGRMPAQISIIADTQRPQLLCPDFRSQATAVYAFRNSEPSAIQWLKLYFGNSAQDLATLPPLHGKLWSWGEPEVRDFSVAIPQAS